MNSFTKRHALVVLGLVELALTALAARHIDRETDYPIFLGLYLAMGIPWLAATYWVMRPGSETGRSGLGIIFSFTVLFRVVLLPTSPVLSDDIYRYVWDGRVAHAGENPYRYPPDDAALSVLRNADYARINNKDIPTIYPPAMQMAFFAVTSVTQGVLGMKAFFVLVDLALCLAVVGLLGARGLRPERVVVYAWSPLPIVEVAASGHNDVLGALFLVVALWAIAREKDHLSLVALTMSGLAKLVGFALLPLFFRHAKKTSFLVVPILTSMFCLPYLDVGTLAFRGLREYGLRWRGNDSLFHVLYLVTGSLERSKVIVAVGLVCLVLVLVMKRTHPVRASYLTVGAILLLTATVHPWYLLWIAPLLCLYPHPAWLFLSVSVTLAYHAAYLATPAQPWEDATWVKLVEYVPFFLLLVLSRRARNKYDTPGDGTGGIETA